MTAFTPMMLTRGLAVVAGGLASFAVLFPSAVPGFDRVMNRHLDNSLVAAFQSDLQRLSSVQGLSYPAEIAGPAQDRSAWKSEWVLRGGSYIRGQAIVITFDADGQTRLDLEAQRFFPTSIGAKTPADVQTTIWLREQSDSECLMTVIDRSQQAVLKVKRFQSCRSVDSKRKIVSYLLKLRQEPPHIAAAVY